MQSTPPSISSLSLSICSLCLPPHPLFLFHVCVCGLYKCIHFYQIKIVCFLQCKTQLFIYGMLHFCHWNIGFIFWKRKSYLVCLSAIWFCLFRKQLKLFYFFYSNLTLSVSSLGFLYVEFWDWFCLLARKLSHFCPFLSLLMSFSI